MSNIHPTAVIDPSAQIDPSTVIGPFTVIGPRVKMGANNHIGPHCVIEHVTMGDGNEVIGGAFLGVKPQDLSYAGAITMVEIGNGNKIRECVTVHRSNSVEVPTRIGNNCLLMANAHVAHDCQLGNNIILANSTGIAGHVILQDRVITSGMVGVHQFTRVGYLALLSGGAMVPLDVPPFCIAQGERARLVGLNVVGMRRAGMNREAMLQVKRAFKTLFRSGLRLEEAIAQLQAEGPTPDVQRMLDFCKDSKRGIMSAKKKMNED